MAFSPWTQINQYLETADGAKLGPLTVTAAAPAGGDGTCVGGSVDLPVDNRHAARGVAGGPGPSVPYAAIAGGLAAAVLAIAAGGWYVRRRFRQRRI